MEKLKLLSYITISQSVLDKVTADHIAGIINEERMAYNKLISQLEIGEVSKIHECKRCGFRQVETRD